MKDSKLIAEFMGIESINAKMRGHLYECPVTSEYVTELEYHTSWDWLMPVVVKLFDNEYNEFDGADDLMFRLNDAIMETNLDSLHRIVVEFISQYKIKNRNL